jgi:hypothetical protein
MSIWLHSGAGTIHELSEATQEGMRITEKIYYNLFKEDLFVTCMAIGMHMVGSFHPFGRAFDIRYPKAVLQSSNLMYKLKNEMHDTLKPLGFDVVFHDSHVHVEYDPK